MGVENMTQLPETQIMYCDAECGNKLPGPEGILQCNLKQIAIDEQGNCMSRVTGERQPRYCKSAKPLIREDNKEPVPGTCIHESKGCQIVTRLS